MSDLSQRKKEFGSLGYVAMLETAEAELEKYQEEHNIEKECKENEEVSVQEELEATEDEEKNFEGCVLEEKNGDNEISEVEEDVKEKQEVSNENENGEENMKELVTEEDGEYEDITEDGEKGEEEINHLKIENFHIESDILEPLLFREELEIVLHSDPTQVVGCFSINISKIECKKDDLPPTLIVHISGKAGKDKGCECGTSVTSCVTMDFFTIDEKRYEYTQANEFSKERQMYLACKGKHYHCETLLRLNADPMDKIVKEIPIIEAKNLVSEGANIVLLRHMALTGFNGKLKVDSILANGLICPSTYTCKEPTVISRQGQDLMVTVIERVVEESPDMQQTLRSSLTCGGQLLEHEWVGGSYLVRVTPHKKVMNITTGYVEKSVPLEHCWKEDMELRSSYKDCMTQQLSTHKSYLVDKPEVKALLADFTQAILLLKPEDVVQFAVGYFTRFTYAEEYTPEPTEKWVSQIVADLLDEMVEISVKLAGEEEVADIIRTLIHSALQKDIDRDLIQLVDSMIESTIKLSDILQILVQSIGREERDKEVTRILATMVKSAVRHKGEKEVKELLHKTVTSAVEQVEEKEEAMKVVNTMLSYAVGEEGEDVVMYLLDYVLKLVVKHEDERKAERDSSGHEIITEIMAEVLSSVTKRDEEEGVIKEATTEASHEEETQ